MRHRRLPLLLRPQTNSPFCPGWFSCSPLLSCLVCRSAASWLHSPPSAPRCPWPSPPSLRARPSRASAEPTPPALGSASRSSWPSRRSSRSPMSRPQRPRCWLSRLPQLGHFPRDQGPAASHATDVITQKEEWRHTYAVNRSILASCDARAFSLYLSSTIHTKIRVGLMPTIRRPPHQRSISALLVTETMALPEHDAASMHCLGLCIFLHFFPFSSR